MQFVKYLSAAVVAAPVVSAAVSVMPRHDSGVDGVSISYATAYLNYTLDVADYGCSSAPNGTVLKKYTKFVDVLEDYVGLIATPWAAADKNACGQCVAITHTTAEGEEKTVYAITVDSTEGYFNLDLVSFAGLDGYDNFVAGTIVGHAETVSLDKCERDD